MDPLHALTLVTSTSVAHAIKMSTANTYARTMSAVSSPELWVAPRIQSIHSHELAQSNHSPIQPHALIILSRNSNPPPTHQPRSPPDPTHPSLQPPAHQCGALLLGGVHDDKHTHTRTPFKPTHLPITALPSSLMASTKAKATM